jgi:putative membrane-bound dehydrogenase-like protein
MLRSFLLTLLLAPCLTFAADDVRGDNPDALPGTPEEELAKFHLPPGFEIQLVAAEPDIQKPINITFDDEGRLWVTGSEMYPWPAGTDAAGRAIPNYEKDFAAIASAFHVGNQAPEPSYYARDTVRILSDFDEHGHAKTVRVFANGLNIPSGIQPLPRGSAAIATAYGLLPNFDPNPAMMKRLPFGGRHIGHAPKGDSAIVYSIPNIWLLTDWDGDGFAESRVPLYQSAGYLDTHGGMSSFLYWTDGWIYGTHGFRNHSEIHDMNGHLTVLDSGNTYRFRPDGSAFEIYTHGQTNPFGLTIDPMGNFYTADSHSKPVYMLIPGGIYEGIGKQADGLGFAPHITEDGHGSTAIGGIAYYADDKFPEEYRGNLFNGNPVTRRVNRDKLEWHGSTPEAIRQPDFITSDDPWFRPVQVKLGPDGALWIADFYNAIIGHYEFPLADPHRDHSHGRIWRVVYRGEKKGEAAPAVPDFTKLDAARLVDKLADPNLEARRLATNALSIRIGREAGPAANAAVRAGTDTQRMQSLAVLESIGGLDDDLLDQLAHDPASMVRAAAVRAVNERDKWTSADLHFVLGMLKDGDANVQRNAVSALAQHPWSEAFEPLVTLITSSSKEDSELQYALRAALRDFLATSEGIYKTADRLAAANPDVAATLADVSLAVKTPEAAGFLLSHLQRTHFAAPRTGEYLKHVALYLPLEKFGAITDLTNKITDAPLAQRLAAADGLSQAARQRGLALPDEVKTWTQHVMVEALDSTDDATLKSALEGVREAKFDAKLDPLAKIAANAHQPETRRIAALEALANLDAGRVVLAQALATPSTTKLRKRAAELLGQSNADDARAALLAALPTAPATVSVAIAISLAANDPGTEALLGTMEAGKAAPTLLRNPVVAALLEKRAQPLRDRATALTRDLPPEDERLDKLIAQRADAFQKATPNAGHGAQIFQQNCAVCHKIHNQGANIGPALDGIGVRGPHRVIEDILDPNRNVDPMFRQTVIETTDGQTLAGLNAHNEGELLVLTDATGKQVSVAQARVKNRTTNKLSLMPTIFETTIAPADFNDLLAFLFAPAP